MQKKDRKDLLDFIGELRGRQYEAETILQAVEGKLLFNYSKKDKSVKNCSVCGEPMD